MSVQMRLFTRVGASLTAAAVAKILENSSDAAVAAAPTVYAAMTHCAPRTFQQEMTSALLLRLQQLRKF